VGSNPTLAAVVLITTLAQFMKPMPDFPLRMFRERVGTHAQISVVIYGKPGRPNELGELAFGHDPYVFDYLVWGAHFLEAVVPSKLDEFEEIERDRRVLPEEFPSPVGPRRASLSPADRHGQDYPTPPR
jgi:hypothetical protein